MTAVDALRAAWAANVRVGVEGTDLVLRAPMPPPATVLDALKLNKPVIVALLRRQLGHWTMADWQAFFDERAGISEHDGGLTRAQAETLAFDHCAAEWLIRHPVKSSPGSCLGCGRGDEQDGIVLPFGTEASGHAWLHSHCWPAWYSGRKAEAAAALSAIGIGSPRPNEQVNNVEFRKDRRRGSSG
jgi:hypothetical protein